MANPEARTEISCGIKIARKVLPPIATNLVGLRLRYETIDAGNSFARAEQFEKDGRNIVIVCTHPSEGETPRLLMELFRHEIMGKRKIIIPAAYHQYKLKYRMLAKLTGIKMEPIVTQSTFDKKENKGREIGYGLHESNIEIAHGLKNKEIIYIYEQGERRPNLSPKPDRRTIATTLSSVERIAKRENLDLDVKKTVFVFVGFEIKGVNDYSKKGLEKLNFGKKYIINVGSCLTYEELEARAKILANERDPVRYMDQVVHDELWKVTPEAYKQKQIVPTS